MKISIAVVCTLFLAGCLSAEGRKIAQESIDKLAARQREAVEEVSKISRTTPVPPDVARLVMTMDEDAASILEWTALSKVDLGRATGDVDLGEYEQSRARAMYEHEIAKRNAIKAAAASAGLPIESPDGAAGVGDVAEMGLKYVLGPAGASIFGLLWRGAKKKQKKAEELAERKKRAAREAIQVIGSSDDTKIRKTAALKRYLLEEYADMKREEYGDRARDIDNGYVPPPEGEPAIPVEDDPLA